MGVRESLRLLQPAEQIRRLLDDQEYRLESEKLQAIAADYDAARARLAAIDNSLVALDNAVRAQVEEAVRARIEDRQLPVRATFASDRGPAAFEVQVLREAMIRQAEKLAEVRARVSAVVVETMTARHRDIAAKVVDLTQQLAEALDKEFDLRAELQRDGISPAMWPQFSDLYLRLGSRRNWGSLVNSITRRCAAYIG